MLDFWVGIRYSLFVDKINLERVNVGEGGNVLVDIRSRSEIF